MTLFTRCCSTLIAASVWLPCAGTAQGAGTHHIAEPGDRPWSGRLTALPLPSGEHKTAQSLPPPAWEAGALLAARGPASRRLLTALAGTETPPVRLAPLQWQALNSVTRGLLDEIGPEGRAAGRPRPGAAGPLAGHTP